MKSTITVIGSLAVASAIFFGFKLSMPAKTEFKVQYAVECSECTVSYRDENSNSVTKENVTGKWEYSYTGKVNHYAFISATTEEDGNPATVKIIIDGEEKNAGSSASKLASANAARILN